MFKVNSKNMIDVIDFEQVNVSWVGAFFQK